MADEAHYSNLKLHPRLRVIDSVVRHWDRFTRAHMGLMLSFIHTYFITKLLKINLRFKSPDSIEITQFSRYPVFIYMAKIRQKCMN